MVIYLGLVQILRKYPKMSTNIERYFKIFIFLKRNTMLSKTSLIQDMISGHIHMEKKSMIKSMHK